MNREYFITKVLINRFILIIIGCVLVLSSTHSEAKTTVETNIVGSPPVITGCPSNVNTTISGCSTSISWAPPVASDPEEGMDSFVSSHVPGDVFPAGVTVVTYTATNNSGETSTCSFEVRVKSNDLFDLTCPSDITYTMNSGCNNTGFWVEPTPSCSGLTVVATHTPGERFEVGATTTITYFAFDGSLIVGRCDFDITINDNTAPTFSNCPSDFTVAANNDCQAVGTWTPPSASDNCTSSVIPTTSHASGSLFTLGATLVTYTATDASGNASTCTFTVTVADQTAPAYTNLPTDMVVSAGVNNCKAIVNWPTVIAEDNCSGIVTVNQTHTSGSNFDLGVNSVVYTATDADGNSNIQSFNITVVDVTSPTLSNCPANIALNATASCAVQATWTAPTFTDKCDASLTIVGSHDSGDFFDVGTTTVTYTATDDAGNETLCSFDIIVNDITAPVFDACPTNMTVSTGSSCTAVVNWTLPTVSDNCDVSVALSSNFASGAVFALGETTVTYTATDAAGNAAICSFLVTVLDETAPVLSSCPTTINVIANSNCEATVNWTAPTAVDNCDSGSEVTLSQNRASGSTFTLGVTEVRYVATDAAGNSSICTFEVIVSDDSAPIISNCPANISLVGDANCGAIANWTQPIISDNCDSTPTVTQSHTSGNRFPLGETLVSYVIEDDFGNESRCEFTVTVIDQIAPSVVNCPSNINLSVGANACAVNASWNLPSFSDNCNSAILVKSTHSPGDEFTIGTTTVIYTAEDQSGNVTNCSFDVTVNDGVAPVFNSCPGNINLTANESCQAIAVWNQPNVTDNCNSEVSLSASHNSGDAFAVGLTSVVYTATDASGNKSECTFDVIVRDLSAPLVESCLANIIASTSDGCNGVVNWTAPEFEDCSEITVRSNYQPGDIFPIGETTVSYIATDINGMEAHCEFTVTVEDKAAPIISSCPTDIVLLASSSCEVVAEWDEPIAADNCDQVVTVQSSMASGDLFPIGVTEVVYEFTDEVGNSSFCIFNITVNDESAFSILDCPEDIVIETDESGFTAVNWTPPVVQSSGCVTVTTTANYQPGAIFEVGDTEVLYDIVDDNGRSLSCSFIISVKIRALAFVASDLLSPNGDGINDFWVLDGLEKFPNNEVIIVDQRGGLIYSGKGYDNRDVVWDGTNEKGTTVPTGTYFYFIRVRTDSEMQEQKGFIEIVN
ncbi:MAG: gliding motility-associated-like protein [Marivirga sp.]|jgi:gliding motility-associated-like protein